MGLEADPGAAGQSWPLQAAPTACPVCLGQSLLHHPICQVLRHGLVEFC